MLKAGGLCTTLCPCMGRAQGRERLRTRARTSGAQGVRTRVATQSDAVLGIPRISMCTGPCAAVAFAAAPGRSLCRPLAPTLVQRTVLRKGISASRRIFFCPYINIDRAKQQNKKSADRDIHGPDISSRALSLLSFLMFCAPVHSQNC